MHIIVFGSSIEQGFDDTDKGGWVNRLFLEYGTRTRGQGHGDFNAVFNLGISGNTSDQIVERFSNELACRVDPDEKTLVIIESGGNDSIRNLETNECAVPLDRFEQNCQTMINEANKYGKVVVLGLYDSDYENMNPIPWYEGHAALKEDADLYDKKLQEMANENEVLYISLSGLFEGKFEELTFDGDHPNAVGHQLVFERVKSALEKEGIL
jgi:lysophospholipase L1-like esterase